MRWQVSAAAAAVATLMGLWVPDASALALGRVKVLSSLGEPLRAEIDIPEITPAEAESLRANPGSAELFRAAGLEYNPSIANVRVSVEHRANGRPYLRLTSTRPVNDPFMDLIVEATWASGRIARDYTMLLDPQGGRGSAPSVAAAAPQITAPQVSPQLSAPVAKSPAAAPVVAQRQAPVAASPADSGSAGAPASPSRAERMAAARAAAAAAAKAPARTTPATATATAAAAAPATAIASPAPASPGAAQVTVQPGDTAGRIAAKYAPPNISLEQMLVAMLRANPSAFVDGNVNLIKAGAVLDLPNASEAGSTAPQQARQTVIAQSRDFNAFRRKLATAAVPAQVAAAERSSSGKLQAQVADSKPATVAPDKLTLSKGSIDSRGAGTTPAEDSFAKTNEARDAAARAAELQKNLNDLNKLQAASATAPAAVAAGAAATPATPATEATSPAATTVAASSASAGSASGAAGVAAPVVAAAAVNPAPAAPVAEASFIDQMLEEPLIPAIGLGLIGLLAGFGVFRSRQRKNAAEEEAFLADANAEPESFFGTSGGQKVDTLDGASHGSSVAYSPSQLDAGGEVDPVAEADVYLAYGRDEQAIDTLKEALRANPGRIAARVKLLEIYGRRQDANAFETMALETRPMVGDDSAEWRRICELGREIDLTNRLYQSAGQTGALAKTAAAATATAVPSAAPGTTYEMSAMAGLGAASAATSITPMAPAAPSRPIPRPAWNLPFDLDLDLGTPSGSGAISAAQPAAKRSAPQGDETERAPLDIDFSDFGGLESKPAATAMPIQASAEPQGDSAPEEPADASNWLATPTRPAPIIAPTQPAPVMAAGPETKSGMIDFDFGSLRLDLEPSPAARAPAAAEPMAVFAAEEAPAGGADEGDALSTKLALAEAFSSIGDVDGARTLAQEVIGESSGTLKAKAQRFLATID